MDVSPKMDCLTIMVIIVIGCFQPAKAVSKWMFRMFHYGSSMDVSPMEHMEPSHGPNNANLDAPQLQRSHWGSATASQCHPSAADWPWPLLLEHVRQSCPWDPSTFLGSVWIHRDVSLAANLTDLYLGIFKILQGT